MAELKRLEFVKTYSAAGLEAVTSSKTYAKALQVYAGTKEHSALKPGLETIEGYLRTYGAPLVAKVSEQAPSVLAKADAKVDSTLAYASHVYETVLLPSKTVQTALELKSRLAASRAENAAAFVEAREQYFRLIEQQIEALKTKGVALSESAVASVRAALADGRAKASAEASVAVEKVSAAWEAFLAAPQVAAALSKASPAVAAAKAKAVDAAKYIAATPTYQAYVAPRVERLAAQPAVVSAYAKVSAIAAPLIQAF